MGESKIKVYSNVWFSLFKQSRSLFCFCNEICSVVREFSQFQLGFLFSSCDLISSVFFFVALKGYDDLSQETQLAFVEELDMIYGRRKLFDVVRFESSLRAQILQWQSEESAASGISLAKSLRDIRGVSLVVLL